MKNDLSAKSTVGSPPALNRKKLIAAMAAAAVVIVLELVGLIQSIQLWGWGMFQFYTQDSNFLALVSCLLFEPFAALYLVRGRPIPIWVWTLRYIAACCLTLTLLVVLFVLIPMAGAVSIVPMLFESNMLYHHLLCPLLFLLSFIFLEDSPVAPNKSIWLAILPTLVYATILIVLNITGAVYGPYPFLHVYEQSVWTSALWLTVIVGGALLIAWLLLLLKNRRAGLPRV